MPIQKQIAFQLASGLTESGYVDLVNEETFKGLIEGKRSDDRLAVLVGEQTEAGFVILGSITNLGEMSSMDVGVINVKNGSRHSIFVQGSDLDTLILRVKNDILQKILTEQRIAEVRLEGNLRIEDEVIYNVLKSTQGKLFSKEDISSDIKSIYKIGFFRDVTVSVTDTGDGKVITFKLEELPLITAVDIEGSEKVSKDDIEGLITVKEKQIFNLSKVQSDIASIKTFYKNAGYLNAQVEYRQEEQEKGLRIVYGIKENRKLTIKEIVFEGNRAYASKELKAIMESSEEGLLHFFTDSGAFDEARLKQDANKLTVFYMNNGYINAAVGEPEITNDDEWIYVKITISEGKQFRVGNVEITGDTLTTQRSDLLARLEITNKDYFDREAVVKDIDILTEACKQEGYAYATVLPRTLSKDAEQKIDVAYNIEKGNLVYINRISITGNAKTKDKVIRRELESVEGELYDSDKIRTSYANLSKLRYFGEVNFQTEKGSAENLMDIDVNVSEKPTGMVSVGAGYSGTENLVFMGKLSQENFLGNGQTLSLTAYLGSETTNYKLSFTEPWLFDMPLWSEFEVWNMERQYDSYSVDTNGFRTTLGYPLFERVKGYVGYTLKNNTIYDLESSASSYIRRQEGSLTSSGVTLTLSRDTTNDNFSPSEGSRNSLSLDYTGTIFQGDASFTKYTANSKWFFGLPFDNVLGLYGRIGYIQANEGREIPVYDRFYLGGLDSIRGLRDVGPYEGNDPIGGETMMCFTAEVIFPVLKDAGLKGVLFFDTGNAWNSGYDPGDMRKTAGVGVRWYSPIGPLRLEWGFILDRKETDPGGRWEFTLGMLM